MIHTQESARLTSCERQTKMVNSFTVGLLLIFVFVFVMGSRKTCPAFVRIRGGELAGWYKLLPKHLNGARVFERASDAMQIFKAKENVTVWHVGNATTGHSLMQSVGDAVDAQPC